MGSIRQHSDIYIRKNGCCWAREESKEAGKEQQHSSYHPILIDAAWHSFCLSCCGTEMVHEKYFFATSVIPGSNGTEVMTWACQRSATSTGGRLMNRFKLRFKYFQSIRAAT